MGYANLSKEISYALRHAPWEYELELDCQGWVVLDQLVYSLNESSKFHGLTEADVLKMIEASEKKRHEVIEGKIRALYGHSVPMKIQKTPAEPPEVLYHGTAQRFVDSITNSGLKPSGRQYVHLSQDIKTALVVGKRRDSKPVILRVQALKAWEDGIMFYHGNEKVWLADLIPSNFIKVLKE